MSVTENALTLEYIGLTRSPFKEKFAIPRQPGLVSAAHGKVYLTAKANNIDLVQGLEQFSHIWLIFAFHGTQEQGWKPLVRPPRLGGNEKMGVLATRSTFRPNPIGMSVVKLEGIEIIDKSVVINVSGLDLLDKTPIIDIKPYIPYSDALPNAQAGFAQTQPTAGLSITFSDEANSVLENNIKAFPQLKQLIEQVLAQDPRPAYKQGKTDNKTYGMALYYFNIQWQLPTLTQVLVTKISSQTPIKPSIKESF